jgi:asparagine synthase (glutamine-hydrolysing)
MCGIAGALCSPGFQFQAGEFEDVLRALGHRGPDDKGVIHTRVARGPLAPSFSLALGATRLSLLDFTGGAQPFHGRRGGLLVFNGEIFNWPELRAELIADGWQPRTRCDTEIVMELLERHGAQALTKLEGMFGLACFDGRRLLVARDPFGIKPLYFAWDPRGWFACASEAKALLRFSRIRPRLSREALFETSVFGYPLDHSTLFAEIEQVPPGTVIEVGARDDGTVELNPGVFNAFPWHSAPKGTEPGDEAVSELLQDRFIAAVQDQLVADHPVGIFLSGGIDSSAIVAAAKAGQAEELHTFSIGDGEDLDDLRAARQVAGRLGCSHHEVIVDFEEFTEAIPRAVLAMEAPRPPSGGEFLARAARQHTKAALCGEGSDELFGGYWVHMRPRSFLGMLLRQYASAYRMVGSGDAASRARTKRRLRWLAERDPNELARKVWLFQLRAQLVNGHLVPWDHATMSESLELRVPYLSQRVASLMLSYPRAALEPAGLKPSVRALARRLMPPDVADLVLSRPKIAFPTSTRRTIRRLGDLAASIVPEAHRSRHPLKGVLPLGFSVNDRSLRDPLADASEALGVLLLDMFVLIFCVHRGEVPEALSIHTLYTQPSFLGPVVDALNEIGRELGRPVDEADDVKLLEAALR